MQCWGGNCRSTLYVSLHTIKNKQKKRAGIPILEGNVTCSGEVQCLQGLSVQHGKGVSNGHLVIALPVKHTVCAVSHYSPMNNQS